MNQPYIGAYSRRFIAAARADDESATRKALNANVESSDPINMTERHFLVVTWNGEMGKVTGSGNYASNGGTSPANSGGATAMPGDTITLTATPDAGYHFVKWQGGPVDGNTNKTVDVTMNDSYSIAAVFAADEYADKDHRPKQTETITEKAMAFVKQWWWAILIVGYIVYKEMKGGKQ